MAKRVLLLTLSMVALMSCETTDTAYVKDGVNYAETSGTFRGRWWSYYERATHLMQGEFYEAAETDLRKALAGRSRDSWQARTYGLHFTEYFPTRELGIVLYKQNRLDEAQQLLERSLAQIDTARAHSYLDDVKRKKIETGALQDTGAPDIATTIPDGALVATYDIPFEIEANDDSGVENVQVNGERLYQRGSAENITYAKEITLAEGTHEVVVQAGDLAEKTATKTQTVTVDLTGPTVGIREPEDAFVTQAPSVRLRGSTVDNYGVNWVRLGDQTLAEETKGADRLQFDTELPLQDGENTFIVVARDMAGNETHTAINVYKGAANSTAALLWRIEKKDPDALKLAAHGDMSPAALFALLQSIEAAQDAKPVQIQLKSPDADRPWRNERAIRVAGKVIANTKVAQLVINGQAVDQLTGEPEESFNRRIVLDKDQFDGNTATIQVAVVAEDDGGNKDTQEVNVEIVPVDLNTRKSRMKLAVLGFGGEVPAELRSELRTLIETSIFATERFNILERQELAAVLSEQQLSDALGDKDAALRLGKVIPAHVFIVADVIQRAPEAEVFIRVVSTETTEQVAAVDANITNTEALDAMKKGADDIATQLREAFPRLGGEIMSARGGKILVNWGQDDGVKESMRVLVVFQEEPWVDEDTGEVLEEGETVPIGQAVVTRVTNSSTTAEKVTSEDIEEEAEFEQGMAAITM